MNSNTNFSCSSWNYGSYSISNPYFKQGNRPTSCQYQQLNMPKNTNYSYNKFGKRILPEEERIVTNDYMSTINHMKSIKESELKKAKKRHNNKNIQKDKEKEGEEPVNEENLTEYQNTNDKKVDIKTDTTDYKFRLSFEEWMEVKRKQQMIFNQIKKIKEEEDKKMEKLNMKVDKKYNEIKEKKYKEWLDNKNKEFRKEKLRKLQKEMEEEQIKKLKDAEREERMNEWFKQQAQKMEVEILEHQMELKRKKEIEKENEEKKKLRKKENKLAFKEWKERKDEEMKIIKQKKLEEEKLKESKSRHSAYNRNKGFTIGPYTDAGALKEIQKFVNEKFTEEDDDEEEGIVNEEGIEGDEEMTPEQLAELENLQKMQMGQYHENQNNENNAGFNNQELEDNNYENYYQQHEGDEENDNNN
jgi:hypothetical protein